MDIDKVFKYKEELENNLTFEEICKCFREIMYAQIAYYGEDNCGSIYNGTYGDEQINQATRVQQKLSTCVDLYNQIISNRRVFDDSYLREKGI